MGAWGTGLYQNDLSADVKDDYISKLKAGKTDEEALQEIMEEYREEMEDVDCKYDFFLGLADTLWKKGRLTEELKIKALEMLEEEKTSDRWEGEKLRKERNRVLDRLKEELNSPMPERKKVRPHKPYITPLIEKGVYTFEITDVPEKYKEFCGWYMVIYVWKIHKGEFKVRNVWDHCPQVYLMLSRGKVTDLGELDKTDMCCSIRDHKTQKKRYRYTVIDLSNRYIPKNLEFLGTYEGFRHPDDEMEENEEFRLFSLRKWNSIVEEGIRDYLFNQEL